MKKILTLILLCNSLNLKAQNQIIIPYGDSIFVDGIISADEWTDTDSIEINFLNTKKVKVYYKHDLENLLFCYKGNLESANVRFPEILLDLQFDRSSNFQSDDWWFHVSATDCEYKGAYGNYSNCALTKSLWTANNITQGVPLTDLVEIKIPFSSIGIQLSNIDTIGISFLVTNTANAFNHWPTNANRLNPSTWGKAIIEKTKTGLSKLKSDDFILFPNPGNTTLYIKTNLIKFNKYEIYNSIGERILNGEINNNSIRIEELKSGMYILRAQTNNKEITIKRFLKN